MFVSARVFKCHDPWSKDATNRAIIFENAGVIILYILIGRSPFYSYELSQKSDFQSLTTKLDNIGHPTVKTVQIGPWGGFQGDFTFFEN